MLGGERDQGYRDEDGSWGDEFNHFNYMELGYHKKSRGERVGIDKCVYEGEVRPAGGLFTLRLPFYRRFQLDRGT